MTPDQLRKAADTLQKDDGRTPETDAEVFDRNAARPRFPEHLVVDAEISRGIERERSGLAARVAELEHAVDLAARTMAGEGVEDQGQAWDKCLRILDAARSK